MMPIHTYRRRQWHPTPVLLPGKSHGQRSLVGCSPWGRWGSDTTERLHFYFSLSCIGEGNGNPLQCSCLENPRDGGAWWIAIYGVTQSRTWLKWFSSIHTYTHSVKEDITPNKHDFKIEVPVCNLWGTLQGETTDSSRSLTNTMIIWNKVIFIIVFNHKSWI